MSRFALIRRRHEFAGILEPCDVETSPGVTVPGMALVGFGPCACGAQPPKRIGAAPWWDPCPLEPVQTAT